MVMKKMERVHGAPVNRDSSVCYVLKVFVVILNSILGGALKRLTPSLFRSWVSLTTCCAPTWQWWRTITSTHALEGTNRSVFANSYHM